MFKTFLVASALTLATANLAIAGGATTQGSVSEAGIVLGSVSVSQFNSLAPTIAGATLTGTTATVTVASNGDVTIRTDTGATFTIAAGFVANLLASYAKG